jgi:hypothetical protein
MKLTLIVTYDDEIAIDDIKEVVSKASELGSVESAKLTGIPSELDLSDVY